MNRIILRTFLVVCVAGAAVSVISSAIYNAKLNRQAVDNIQTIDAQAVLSTDSIFRMPMQMPYYIRSDTELCDLIRIVSSGKDTAHMQMYLSRIELKLSRFLSHMDIHSIAIVTDTGTVFSPVFTKGIDISSQIHSGWYREYKEGRYAFYFSSPYKIAYWNATSLVFTYAIPYEDIGGTSGDILITCNFDAIRSIMKVINTATDAYMWLDSRDLPFDPFPDLQNNQDKIDLAFLKPYLAHATLSSSSVVKSEQGYYFIQFSEKSNWKLISFVSYRTLFSSYSYTVKILLVALLCGFLGIIVFLVPLLSVIIKPLHILSAVMKNISEDNYAVHVNIHTADEIGDLSDSFNHMIDQIQINTKRLIENEREAFHLKQGLIIARINPHFIYNTLNTVTYLARKNKTADIIIVNNALIELLQDTLRVTDTELYDTLGRELTMVEKYVVIQRYRYNDSFKMEIAADEKLLQQKIPKGIIQPLVENSLFHGFISDDGNCDYRVKIKAEGSGAFLILRVSDNGAGMSEALLQSVSGPLDGGNILPQPVPGASIGIRNIRQRLYFLYGDDTRFSISSVEGKGTDVTIRLDMDKPENEISNAELINGT